MNSDSAFYIGTTHNICEDYAINNQGMIAVSDGCSSSIKTDIGSRIICECAKKYKGNKLLDTDGSNLMSVATSMAEIMGISRRCLDATLLNAFIKDDKVIIETIGDGNIIYKDRNGNIYIYIINYDKSAPYYMSYLYNSNDQRAWEEIKGNKFSIKEITIFKDGEIIRSRDECKNYDNFYIPYCDHYFFSPKVNKISLFLENIEWVALSSDGLSSFYEKINNGASITNNPIDIIDIIKELLVIRNTNGRFIQRRLNKFRKTCEKRSWYNADDVSLALLYLGK